MVEAATFESKSLFGPRVVLRADGVEITRNGTTQTYAKAFIKGFRSYAGRGVTYFTLELLNEPKPVKFSVGSSRVSQARAALAGLTDLDAADRRTAEEAIRNDLAYGATPEERWQTLQNEKRLAMVANIAAGLIAAWALIFPNPYALSVIVCAAVTPAALALSYVKRARWFLFGRRNDPHPTVSIAIVASAIGALRALIDLDVLDWGRLWLIAAIAGVALTVVVLLLFGLLKLKNMAAAIVGVAFAFGIVAQADALLDKAPSETFHTRVLDTHVSHGRSTSYSATLGPWGPETGDNYHGISSGLYYQLSPGGEACVTLHPGALHMRWYVIGTCDAVAEPFAKPDPGK